MNISRTKFVFLFLVAAFSFQFFSNSILGSEVRGFPAHGESFLGMGSPVAWKNTVSIVFLPIKIVLIGPLLPIIEYLRQSPDYDPPPPFIALGFAFYWSLLAAIIHYFIRKFKHIAEK